MIRTSNTNTDSISVGIDLGTTSNVICVETNSNSKPKFILDSNGQPYIESIVAYGEDHYTVGKDARFYPSCRIIIDNKRFIGKRYSQVASTVDLNTYAFKIKSDEHDLILYELKATNQYKTHIITPIMVATILLKYVKKQIDRYFGINQPRLYTITVPSYFDSVQRKAIAQAGICIFLCLIIYFIFNFPDFSLFESAWYH